MQTVLIADDDPLLRHMLRQVFTMAGLRVIEAANGEQAIRSAVADGPDVAVIDLIMPVVDGIEAIGFLRTKMPTLKILAISGGGRARHLDILSLARRMGADVVLEKPFSNQKIVEIVLALCAADVLVE